MACSTVEKKTRAINPMMKYDPGQRNTRTSSLLLNIVPISFSADSILVGRVKYENRDIYKELREVHWHTHAFRYDNNSGDIFNIAVVPGTSPLGRTEQVAIQIISSSSHVRFNGRYWYGLPVRCRL